MKFSVVIPAFNASRTLDATIQSVFSQTFTPLEIIVLDDGSTDSTAECIAKYGSKLRAFRQENQGLAAARNFMCKQARGDVIAFLDSDDVWHPRYLEAQLSLIEKYPNASGYFTNRTNHEGYDGFSWESHSPKFPITSQLIAEIDFFDRYNRAPMDFQPSCCCVRKAILAKIGEEPFQFSGAEDAFFYHTLILFGPIAYTPQVFSMYRILSNSMSAKRLKNILIFISSFTALKSRYLAQGNEQSLKAFNRIFASKRRLCGKFLMGANRVADARSEFICAIRTSVEVSSMLKSAGLLASSYLPNAFLPSWPSAERIKNAPSIR